MRQCLICKEHKPDDAFETVLGYHFACLQCRYKKRKLVAAIARAQRTPPAPAIKERKKFRGYKPKLRALVERRLKRMGSNETAGQYAKRLADFPKRITRIVAQTYEVVGDGPPLFDDEAIAMIRDEIDALDPRMIERALKQPPRKTATKSKLRPVKPEKQAARRA